MKTDLTKLSEQELRTLHTDIQVELNNRDPRIIAQRQQAEAHWAAYEQQMNIRNDYTNRVLKGIKGILKPGMRLKMTGCKDGKGFREFIKFDENDHLVCWQIAVHRQWKKTGMGDKGSFVTTEEKTNQVTTHMPDKVSWILVDGKKITAKSLA